MVYLVRSLFNSLLVIFVMLLGCSCNNERTFYVCEGHAEGTYFRITYQGDPLWQDSLINILHNLEASLSIYDPTSLISQFNRSNTITMDTYFQRVWTSAYDIWQATNGKYDVSVMPLVNFWGFGFQKTNIDTTQLDSLRQLIGLDKIQLSPDRKQLYKTKSGMMLDFNSIAKGFSVDLVAEYLDNHHCSNYLIDIGGECRAKGKNPKKKPWRIGIETPNPNQSYGEDLAAKITLSNKSIATSGNYRRFFEQDGVRYAHSIDIKTGYPVKSKLLSCSIIADDCTTADGWATACMVSGLEDAIQYLDRPDIDGMLIYDNGNQTYGIYTTPRFQALILNE